MPTGPAARMGDMTAHGTPLAPGPPSPNVLIGGQPAWRGLSDIHACPIVKGVVPDGAGVVINGSATVFINGLPACRMGDTIQEASAVNSIMQGAPNVIIGG